ncbi:MAG: hypothetical protein ACN4GZ_00005, partial [Acidimicrobiales bacterium]
RNQRGLSWASMSRHVGVSSSTIRRFGEAEDAEADGVLALVRWLGVAPEAFVLTGASVEGIPLTPSSGGFVRVDMDLVRETTAGQDIALGRSRLSIQNLVTIAHQSKLPMTSLTRQSVD